MTASSFDIVRSALKRQLYPMRKAVRRSTIYASAMMRRIGGRPCARPALVIIGAQKAGTTSLFSYLVQHPQVVPPSGKEIHFFDIAYGEGTDWYLSHFPEDAALKAAEDATGLRHITIESTPYYLFHPAVPERLHRFAPDTRIVIMLRDPVARAVSHYWHEFQRGFETLPLAEALQAEEERLAGTEAIVAAASDARSFAHQHHSYKARSAYPPQVRRWMALFPRAQIHFVRSEDFFADPARETGRVVAFAGLAPAPHLVFDARNQARHGGIADALAGALRAELAARNAGLTDLAGPAFTWPVPWRA